jgi:uncharacterized tellurite resistance protein B-like protein
MFLHNLKQKEKEAFLALIKKFIRVDEKISDSEKTILNQLQFEMGCDSKIHPRETTLDECLESFESKTSKVSVLLEIVGLGYADTEYGVQESKFVKKIAEAFGIDKNELIAMENYCL